MKTLRELFKQYTPSEEIGSFFDSVKEYVEGKAKVMKKWQKQETTIMNN